VLHLTSFEAPLAPTAYLPRYLLLLQIYAVVDMDGDFVADYAYELMAGIDTPGAPPSRVCQCS
jgi:hypothetical protein